ncbi:MAG: type II/IV secretion system ATPase subunit [Candidatus Woesearchaeota archaeon]
MADRIISKEEEHYEPLFKVSFPQEIPVLPSLKKGPAAIDVRYQVIDPYAYIHIYWDEGNSELVYEVEEPKLNEEEMSTLKLIEEGLTELINISFVNIESEKVIIEFIEKNLKLLLNELGIKVTEDTFLKLMYYIYRNFIGLGPIEPLMRDYFIEDIECNGVNAPIYIVHRRYSNLRTTVKFQEFSTLTSFVEKLAQKCSQYVSYANPLLDGSLPDGSRVNATYTEDVTSRGPSFTIRKFTREPWTPIKLMDFKTVPPEILAYLWLLIEYRSNILVIGGTGSGKTSFLNAMAFFIPPAARVVSIEDTRELNLKHENWLPAVARKGVGTTSITGAVQGEVSLFDLLREGLRQRPDYIIVGEIRGKEAFVLFQAMASGHPSYCTMHAESVDSLIKRLTTAPISLSPALVEAMDAVCIMIPAKVEGKDLRKLREINEIIKINPDGSAIINTPFTWDPREDKFLFKTDSKIFEKILKRTGMKWDDLLKEFRRRSRLLMAMYRKRVFGFAEVQEVIHQYYKTPEKVMQQFGITDEK